jgi:glutamine amidotransferase
MIGIIDYGIGNLSSVYKAIRFLGFDAVISKDVKVLSKCGSLILPGVGAFTHGMNKIKELNLMSFIKDSVSKGKPFLGICLGLQLLFENSEEGPGEGLSIVKGTVKELPPEIKLKIPHMGWNCLICRNGEPIFSGMSKKPYVYFVHSFYVAPEDEEVTIAKANYGIEFTAGIKKDNVYGFQFHPEKSGEEGLKLLGNWLKITNEEMEK